MAEQRLPTVNGDDGAWGDILNLFLSKEHYNTGLDSTLNGGHQHITLRPGTIAAGTAPIKFASGPLLTTPEVGALEFLTDKLYFTQTTSTTRKTVAIYDDASGATGDLHYRDSSGNLVRLAIGGSNYVLTSNGTTPVWTAPTSGLSQAQVMAISSLRI